MVCPSLACGQVRGLVAAELTGKADYSVLEGGFKFTYAVYDEVRGTDFLTRAREEHARSHAIAR